MDPLAAQFAEWSPYNYVVSNPIYFVDPTGKKADDYFVFNEDGEYQRTEENDETDQIVIENSETGNRSFIQFNDVDHDVKLLKANFARYSNGGVGKKILFFVNNGAVGEMMKQSNIKHRSYLARRIFAITTSKGGKMDFSAYHLPIFVQRIMRDEGRLKEGSKSEITWSPSSIGIDGGEEKVSPFFIFEGGAQGAYNWLDAGNRLWGHAVHGIGGTLEDAWSWSKKYKPDDSDADWRAILAGWQQANGSRILMTRQ